MCEVYPRTNYSVGNKCAWRLIWSKGPRNIPHAAALIWRPAILGYSVTTAESKSLAHKFKDDHEVETIGTLWLIVQDMD